MQAYIQTKSGHKIVAKHIKTYNKGILWFVQERLITTDFNHDEIVSLDIIDLVKEII